ncbi:MAG TPA: DEAD/DEAH box helicase family protein [Anaerolineaceae bacterium]|nr:DEAD/DEAH box helicase family protein [Anaerolineaceae bacterium]HPN51224.1 DEAD/DEAH box helicase family protein [Anaerolineaceae bacterium]
MLKLKEYQQRALDTLQKYFRLSQTLGDADTAFYQITREIFGRGIPYHPIETLPGLPYICIRIPTGGGKTLVASHAVGIAAHELLHTDHALVLWLAPSNIIRDQTLQALSNLNHPYRQAIESRVGPVTVMSISDALYIQPSTLNTSTTILVGTIQAFRVDNTEGRKVYESSGALMSHFTNIPPHLRSGLEMTDGEPKRSLANVLFMRRPIVVVDEAHNARTPLSFDTLARFHPSCILEFSATPATQDHPSNVVHSCSAAELKTEAMIKLPIRLKVRSQWKELLSEAIIQRNHLEAVTQTEQRQTGEYIRPIMLLQAQARSQNKETLTVDVVRQTLMDDFKIPENQIARATGEIDEISDIDLQKPDCPIRYIITVQALREGWDCPFAYVLCSVVESKSSTAIEQILGRILRLPKATRKQNFSLNLAYAYATSQNFSLIANQLRDSLISNGFEKLEAQSMIQAQTEQPHLPLFGFENEMCLPEPMAIAVSIPPALDVLPKEMAAKIHYEEETNLLVIREKLERDEADLLIAMLPPADIEAGKHAMIEQATRPQSVLPTSSPSERGLPFNVPKLMIQRNGQLELFEETILLDRKWKLSQCDSSLNEVEFSLSADTSVMEIEYDITNQGKVEQKFIDDLQETMMLFAHDEGWTPAELVFWLDHAIPHPDVIFREANAFLTRLVMSLIDDRGISINQLVANKYRLRDAVAQKIQYHRAEARKKAYNLFLLPDIDTPLEVSPDHPFTYSREAYPYNSLYRGIYPFKKHYYPQVGDLEDHGEEFNCAVYLDKLPEVKYWIRNLERRPNHSFWLQTSTDRFYPDFVCFLNDGRFLIVEYKGADRWSNDDSREKRIIGEVWEKRSGGKCLFIMPKGQDWAAVNSKLRG